MKNVTTKFLVAFVTVITAVTLPFAAVYAVPNGTVHYDYHKQLPGPPQNF